MVYFLTALALVLISTGIYFSYQKSQDKKKFFLSVVMLVILLALSYSTKLLLIYKPLLIAHIALLIMAWRGLYLYVFKNRLNPYWIFSPLVSLLTFVIIALFFKENG